MQMSWPGNGRHVSGNAAAEPSAWEVGPEPERSRALDGAEQADAADATGALRRTLAGLWNDRLSAAGADGAGRSELAKASCLAAEDGGSSCLVSEPSRLVLDKSSAITEVRTSLGNAVSTSNARRTLTRGGWFMIGRPAITVAEREGRDTEQAPAGTSMWLGRRYVGAKVLHVRRLSLNSALAVTLCRTLSDDGARVTTQAPRAVLVSPLVSRDR